jgi:hypothetical protein
VGRRARWAAAATDAREGRARRMREGHAGAEGKNGMHGGGRAEPRAGEATEAQFFTYQFCSPFHSF